MITEGLLLGIIENFFRVGADTSSVLYAIEEGGGRIEVWFTHRAQRLGEYM